MPFQTSFIKDKQCHQKQTNNIQGIAQAITTQPSKTTRQDIQTNQQMDSYINKQAITTALQTTKQGIKQTNKWTDT
jgi:hypothetical protein